MLSPIIYLSALTPAPLDVDFLTEVYPIFEAHCIECHGPQKQKGSLRLDTRAGLFEGDEDFIPVVPGEPDLSTVIEMITLDADDPDLMPKKADKLSDEDIATIQTWIEEGATWEQPPVAAVRPNPLALPSLSPEQIVARDKALAALSTAGVRVDRIAENSEALEVNLSLFRGKGADDRVSLLTGLEPVLVWANLAGTDLSDKGLAKLADFKALRRMNLSGTAITDSGLARIADLGELRSLNLYGTAVSDAGLEHLAALGSLERLYLWGTAVTSEAAIAFQARHPGAIVNTGADLVLEQIVTVATINTECPVTGKPIDVAFVALVNDKKVGLCCAKCKSIFEADPETYLAKLVVQKPSPVNELCPVSGEPIVADYTSLVGEDLVGFCCGKCKAAFDAAPDEFLKKLGIKKDTPKLNSTCPVSGEPVDAAVTSVYKGRTVALCCKKCKQAFDAEPESFADKLGDFQN